MERMENDMISKRTFLGEDAGTCSVSGSWKRWKDTVKECLRKRDLGKEVEWCRVAVNGGGL